MPGLVRSEVHLWLVALAALLAALLAWAAARRLARGRSAAPAYTPEAIHPASLPAGGFGGTALDPA